MWSDRMRSLNHERTRSDTCDDTEAVVRFGRVTAGASRVATVVANRMGLEQVLGVDVRVEGLDRLPQGGLVVAFNHLSPVDPFLVAWLLARAGHVDPVVLMRDDVPDVPVVTRLLESGVLQVADDTPDTVDEDPARSMAFGQARDQVAAGRPVLIAPERGVSPSLELMPLRSGAAALATETGAPLVPVGLFGTHRPFDGDRFRFRRGVPVTVTFGHPVLVGSSVRHTTKMLHLDMEALHERALDDYPDREAGEAGAAWWPARRGGEAPSLAAVIDARADGRAVVGDPGDEDLVAAEVWQDDAVAMPEVPADLPEDDALPAPVRAMGHDELLERYPRSYHRNAAQQGGYLRDLKGVVAFDVPRQPHQHHPVVHLDHHVDGRLTIFTDEQRMRLDQVDLSASPARVVVYGRVEVPLVVDTPDGPVPVPAGTLATFLGVPQDRQRPIPITDWEMVKSLHMQA